MVFPASPLRLLTVLYALALASLSSSGRAVSSSLRPGHASLASHHTPDHSHWKVLRTRLRGEEEGYMLEALRELDIKVPDHNEKGSAEAALASSDEGELEGKEEEEEEEEEGELEIEEDEEGGGGEEERHPAGEFLLRHQAERYGEERHPADELLRRHQADATVSYILGGY